MSAVFEVRGHRKPACCVTDACERFILGRGLRDVVKFRWKMVSTKDGAVAGLGLEFPVIDAEGRIRSDYQFIES